MSELSEYVVTHTQRGDCTCGKCIDAPPDAKQPEGHTVDMVFFKVAGRNEPDKDRFLELIRSHEGEWGSVDPLDGKEHSYIELGGWIGDQGLAMQAMALGVLVGAWRLLSPAILGIDGDLAKQMVGAGLLSIQAAPKGTPS